MKKTLFTSLFFLPFLALGQWSQLGTTVDGTTDYDRFGFKETISLDSAGTTLAVGSPYHDGSSPSSGIAQVFDWNGTSWVQRGNTFHGDSNHIGTGAATSLSADGMSLAIGSTHGFNSLGYQCGVVRVYDWTGTTWVQRGATIEGEGNANPFFDGDVFGCAVSLTPDGNYIAIGARENTPQVGVLQISGHARVYHWDGQTWNQMGQDLDSQFGGEGFGGSIDISADGSAVAVGGRGFAQDTGLVRIFDWDGTTWNQRGNTLFGFDGGQFGHSVDLSSDGQTLAIGAPKSYGFNGSARVMDWNGTAWVQRGSDVMGLTGGQAGNIALSANGNVLAMGEPWLNSLNGGVRINHWDGTAWTPVPLGISGSNLSAFGSEVGLNWDGSRVAIGASSESISGNSEGRVYVYENQLLQQPDAGFSVDGPPCFNQTTFLDQSASAGNWDWDFGPNATPQTATGAGPHTVSFSSTSAQTVSLVVSNFGGLDTTTSTILPDSAPTPAFTTQNLGGITLGFTNGSTNATSYLWQFGDGSTDTAANPTHTYLTEGTYQVTLTATNDCGPSDIVVQITVDEGVGLEELFAEGLRVYPNPAHNLFFLESDQSQRHIDLRLFDLSGKQIAHWQRGAMMARTTEAFELADIAPGLYLMQIKTNHGMAQMKLVVE